MILQIPIEQTRLTVAVADGFFTEERVWANVALDAWHQVEIWLSYSEEEELETEARWRVMG